MNYAVALGAYLVGLTAHHVTVKATLSSTPGLTIGEPLKRNEADQWKETRTRIRAALSISGIDTGFQGFVVEFGQPVPRTPTLDLAIFAACMGALGKLPDAWCVHHSHRTAKCFFGSLGLQGEVCKSRGVLALLSKEDQITTYDGRQFVIPYANAEEASHADTGTNVYAIRHIRELDDLSAHTLSRQTYAPKRYEVESEPKKLPVRVVRAIEVAVATRKPIHFIGHLGRKAARLVWDLLPVTTRVESMEAACLHSIAGLDKPFAMRPYRGPHYVIAADSLVGGGSEKRPGEVSLAHNGVLFLENLPQFKRGSIEALATVLREQKVSIVRAKNRVEYKAEPFLVTHANRCPCIGEKASGEHSEFCAMRPDRKSDPTRDPFYLGWQTHHLTTLGIETIVDSEFGPDDVQCTDSVVDIRARVEDLESR